jgi:hypothetical protein
MKRSAVIPADPGERDRDGECSPAKLPEDLGSCTVPGRQVWIKPLEGIISESVEEKRDPKAPGYLVHRIDFFILITEWSLLALDRKDSHQIDRSRRLLMFCAIILPSIGIPSFNWM